MLFVGPPGLGKTTLAQIVARELGVNFRSTSGPVIAKAGDLAAQLTNLEPRDVLFIDEIHRLNPAVEEILYPAMEDFQLDLIIGAGPAARSVKIDLAQFTLIGATTRAGLLTTPLRDRFGIPIRLNFYTAEELQGIVARGARVIGLALADDGANEIARRSRGTPRIAGRLLRRVRDFAVVEGAKSVTRALADGALKLLDVDAIGLDQMDRRYLDVDRGQFRRRPGRRRDHRRRALRAARRDRGHHRALSHPAGLRAAHAARTAADARTPSAISASPASRADLFEGKPHASEALVSRHEELACRAAIMKTRAYGVAAHRRQVRLPRGARRPSAARASTRSKPIGAISPTTKPI